MKKIILLLVFAALTADVLNAQKAIGLRLGYDAQEFSYQNSIGSDNRFELTLGVNTFDHNSSGNLCRGVGLNGVYQWVHNLSSVADGLNWYYGFGVAGVLHGGLFGAGIDGQIGVEYNFNSPFQLSLDYRPGFYWLPDSGKVYRFSWNVPCAAIRYRF